MKTTRTSKKLSKAQWLMIGGFIIFFLGCILPLVLTACLLKGPSMKVAIVYPEKNTVVVVKATEDTNYTPTYSVAQTSDSQTDNGSYYEYPDVDKPIDEYENVTFAEHPYPSQIVRQEEFFVEINGRTELHRVTVYGDGHFASGPI